VTGLPNAPAKKRKWQWLSSHYVTLPPPRMAKQRQREKHVRFGPNADIIGKSTLHLAKNHETGSRIKDQGGLPVSFLSM